MDIVVADQLHLIPIGIGRIEQCNPCLFCSPLGLTNSHRGCEYYTGETSTSWALSKSVEI
jgi:hypothetical protein